MNININSEKIDKNLNYLLFYKTRTFLGIANLNTEYSSTLLYQLSDSIEEEIQGRLL